MKKAVIIGILSIIFLSCGGSDSAKDESDPFNNKVVPPDSLVQLPVEDKVPANTSKSDAASSSFSDNSKEILSHIDRYLVSSTEFSLLAAGEGFNEAIVTLKNTLSDITIQKAFLEVSILTADDKEYRTDYYTLQNIEPGDIKSVKVSKSSRGVKITSHIVKLKSDILTNGEMILVGEHYTNN